MGVHDGHRQRMKSRFLEAGLDGFNDHNALEMLLSYALPRKDTNELAHKLLNHFGSLAAVLEADQKALSEIDGIGENAAVLLKLIPAISRRYMEEVMAPRKSVESAEQLGRCCRMVEFEPVYIDVIIKRWEELTGMKAVFVRNIHNEENKQKEKPAPAKE